MPVTQPTDSDNENKDQLSLLNNQFGSLQRQAILRKIPIVLIFEGADGAGKGALINRLLLSLDPRGFKVHTMHSPSEESIYRPFSGDSGLEIGISGNGRAIASSNAGFPY